LLGYSVIAHAPTIEMPLQFRYAQETNEGGTTFTPIEFFNYMVSCGIKAPQIVFRQAVLETSHFLSEKFTIHNNLFGMKEPMKDCYATFENWKQAVDKYLLWQKIQERRGFDLSNYYAFLENVGYAEDTAYIEKLKGIKLSRYID
jgi:hypothetical protein